MPTWHWTPRVTHGHSMSSAHAHPCPGERLRPPVKLADPVPVAREQELANVDAWSVFWTGIRLTRTMRPILESWRSPIRASS